MFSTEVVNAGNVTNLLAHIKNQKRQRRNVCEEGLLLVAVYEWECVSQNNSFCTRRGRG